MRTFNFQKQFVILILAAIVLTGSVSGYPKMTKEQALKAPWELVIKAGSDKGLAFPINIDNRDKSEKLNTLLPVTDASVVAVLKEYYPDLQKEDTIVADPKGGSIASVSLKGKNLDKTMMLISDDPARRSISSTIGGIAIRKFGRMKSVETFLKEIADKKGIGVLTVELKDKPVDIIVGKKGKYKIDGTDYSIEVLEYMPHYSVDKKTKKVKNASKMPTNPAVKIRFNDGKKDYEKWLWSRFAVSPHELVQLPVKVVFNDFDLADSEGRYILVQDKKDTWVNYIKGGKRIIEKSDLEFPYQFKDKSYAFVINEIVENAVIKSQWKNKSEKLLNPVFLLEVTQGGISNNVLLQFGKSVRVKTKSGTLVIYYRHKQSPFKSK